MNLIEAIKKRIMIKKTKKSASILYNFFFLPKNSIEELDHLMRI